MNKWILILITILAILLAGAMFLFFNGTRVKPEATSETPGSLSIIDRIQNIFSQTENPQDPPTSIIEGGSTPPPPSNENLALPLERIGNNPIAGFMVHDDTSNKVRYMESALGHIYEKEEGKMSERLTNTTIAHVQNVYWAEAGERVLAQFLSTNTNQLVVATFSGKLQESNSENETPFVVRGSFLPENIIDMSVSPRGEKIFYLLKDGGESFGIRANPDGSSAQTIFRSLITEWLTSWKDARITLTTKPAYNIAGIAYSLNPERGVSQRILAPTPGLTTNEHPEGTYILYAKNGEGNLMTLAALNQRTNEVLPLSLKTLPEKCVWSKEKEDVLYCGVPETIFPGNYPDDWYQGKISFTDTLWEVNLNTKTTLKIADLEALSGESLDIIDLALSKDEESLYFKDKRGGMLWQYRFTTPNR